MSDLITHLVTVNRVQAPQKMLNATGRNYQHTDLDVVKGMPRGKGKKVKVTFFRLGHWVSDDDLEKEYEARGLKPADPYSLAKVNEDIPSFADSHPNATHWKDSDGKWCCVAFSHWRVSERCVDVGCCNGCGWRGDWWFAGLSA